MNGKLKLSSIIAPLALGVGLIGANLPAMAHPDNYNSSNSNYHQRSFIEIQPFRSLNVTPKYYTPLPRSRSSYYNRYDEPHDRYNHRQRRVYRRGYRKPIEHRGDRDDYPEDHYIRIIRVR